MTFLTSGLPFAGRCICPAESRYRGCSGADGGVLDRSAVPAAGVVAKDGLSEVPGRIETRNVLIVGAGRVGHALRNHIDTLQHLGFRFKGFVALSEREAESAMQT